VNVEIIKRSDKVKVSKCYPAGGFSNEPSHG